MRIEIGQTSFEVQLQPFRSEENIEYLLVDTGCVLGMLKRLKTIRHIIKKKELKLAILEGTIYEVSEHLCKSKESLLGNQFSTFHIDSAAGGLIESRKTKRSPRTNASRLFHSRKRACCS